MLSELTSPRLIITRKRNQRKLKTRSEKFQAARLEKSLDLSIESVIGADDSSIKQDSSIQISSLNLDFGVQEQKPEQCQEMASSRFRTLKIEIQNDSLRTENEDLKQQLKDLRQLLDLRTCEESKQSELSVSTITQEAINDHQSSLHQIDLLKQICESLRRQNYHLRKQLEIKEFTTVMLKKRLDFKPRPNLVKHNRELEQLKSCTKCKNFREMKSRNKTLNQLVLSLSDRLNNFGRDNAEEVFQLSPN